MSSRAGETDPAVAAFVEEKLREWPPSQLSPLPLISGEDLIRLGMSPGPSFKKILTAVEDEQLEERLSTREAALDFVRERFG
jgi:poly(A) polymerase